MCLQKRNNVAGPSNAPLDKSIHADVEKSANATWESTAAVDGDIRVADAEREQAPGHDARATNSLVVDADARSRPRLPKLVQHVLKPITASLLKIKEFRLGSKTRGRNEAPVAGAKPKKPKKPKPKPKRKWI